MFVNHFKKYFFFLFAKMILDGGGWRWSSVNEFILLVNKNTKRIQGECRETRKRNFFHGAIKIIFPIKQIPRCGRRPKSRRRVFSLAKKQFLPLAFAGKAEYFPMKFLPPDPIKASHSSPNRSSADDFVSVRSKRKITRFYYFKLGSGVWKIFNL